MAALGTIVVSHQDSIFDTENNLQHLGRNNFQTGFMMAVNDNHTSPYEKLSRSNVSRELDLRNGLNATTDYRTRGLKEKTMTSFSHL